MAGERPEGTIGVVWMKNMDEIVVYTKADGLGWIGGDTYISCSTLYQRLLPVMSLEQTNVGPEAFYYTPEEFEAITGMRL